MPHSVSQPLVPGPESCKFLGACGTSTINHEMYHDNSEEQGAFALRTDLPLQGGVGFLVHVIHRYTTLYDLYQGHPMGVQWTTPRCERALQTGHPDRMQPHRWELPHWVHVPVPWIAGKYHTVDTPHLAHPDSMVLRNDPPPNIKTYTSIDPKQLQNDSFRPILVKYRFLGTPYLHPNSKLFGEKQPPTVSPVSPLFRI